jgi:hypothetical protein
MTTEKRSQELQLAVGASSRPYDQPPERTSRLHKGRVRNMRTLMRSAPTRASSERVAAADHDCRGETRSEAPGDPGLAMAGVDPRRSVGERQPLRAEPDLRPANRIRAGLDGGGDGSTAATRAGPRRAARTLASAPVPQPTSTARQPGAMPATRTSAVASAGL